MGGVPRRGRHAGRVRTASRIGKKMSKKKPVIRFTVTIDAGRVFYVYAASQVQALDRFKAGYSKPTSRIDVEEDKAAWKTTLQEGPTASGRVVAAL